MSGFDDALGQIGQVLGAIGGNVLNAVNIAASIQGGNLQHYLANRASLGQDPGFRTLASQPGFGGAFYSGMGGFGPPNLQVDPTNIRSGYGNEGQIIQGVNTALPALTPQAQAEQAQAIRQAQMGSMTPEMAAAQAQAMRVGQPGGPSRAQFQTPFGTETFGGQPTGGGIGMNWPIVQGPGGNLYAVDPNTGRGHLVPKHDEGDSGDFPDLSKLKIPQPGQAPAAGAAPKAPADATPGAVRLTPSPAAMANIKAAFDAEVAAGRMTPAQRDEAVREAADPSFAVAADGSPLAPPAAATTSTPTTTTSTTSTLAPGHVAPGDITAKTWADYATSQPKIGYPSPAFAEGPAPTAPQAAPQRAGAPPMMPPPTQPAEPPRPYGMPPGMTAQWNKKSGWSVKLDPDKAAKIEAQKAQGPPQLKGQVGDQLRRLDSAIAGYRALYGDPSDPSTGVLKDATGKEVGKVRDLLPSGKSMLGIAQSETLTPYVQLPLARKQGDVRAQAFETGQPQAIDFARAAGGAARMNAVELTKLAKAFVPSGHETQEEYDNKVILTLRFFSAIRDGLTHNLAPETMHTIADQYVHTMTGSGLDDTGSPAPPPTTTGTVPPVLDLR